MPPVKCRAATHPDLLSFAGLGMEVVELPAIVDDPLQFVPESDSEDVVRYDMRATVGGRSKALIRGLVRQAKHRPVEIIVRGNSWADQTIQRHFYPPACYSRGTLSTYGDWVFRLDLRPREGAPGRGWRCR